MLPRWATLRALSGLLDAIIFGPAGPPIFLVSIKASVDKRILFSRPLLMPMPLTPSIFMDFVDIERVELEVPMIVKSHAGIKIGELIIDTYDI